MVKPVISRNLTAELNAAMPRAADGSRAEPVYFEALAALPVMPDDLQRVWPEVAPGTPEWAGARAYLREAGTTVEATRLASAMPVLGLVLSDAPEPRWGATPDARAAPPRAGSQNPNAIAILLPHLGSMRALTRLVSFDAMEAAEAGDG